MVTPTTMPSMDAASKDPTYLTLTRSGMSSIGARQALEGHGVSDPNDRQVLTRLLQQSLQQPVPRWNLEHGWPAK